MDTLVRGIDYEVLGDEEPDHAGWIEEAHAGGPQQQQPCARVWAMLDAVIDDAVRDDGLLGGLEPLCEAAEDYCAQALGVAGCDVPRLYRYVFEARGGFLTQSKAIHYLQGAWLQRYPEPMAGRQLAATLSAADPAFLAFLHAQPDKYRLALRWFGGAGGGAGAGGQEGG